MVSILYIYVHCGTKCWLTKLSLSVPTGSPEYATCRVLNLTTLEMSWSEPHPLEQNGPIEQYWIFVWNTDTNEMVYNTSTMSSLMAISVAHLEPYHNYDCNIAAYARRGLGPFTGVSAWLTDSGE